MKKVRVSTWGMELVFITLHLLHSSQTDTEVPHGRDIISTVVSTQLIYYLNLTNLLRNATVSTLSL